MPKKTLAVAAAIVLVALTPAVRRRAAIALVRTTGTVVPPGAPVTSLDSAVEKAWAEIDDARLTELVVAMVAIPSPTGEERALAEYLTGQLAAAGLAAAYQPIDATQGNAVGRLRGAGTGPDLLLYAPIDTFTTGDEAEDVPVAGDELRPDMRPIPIVDGPHVLGLGASNPKGHGACVLAAVEAVARAGIPLRGDVIAAFGAGGMPTNKRDPATRWNAGQGTGASFLLEQGVWADYAIIAKPGWAVAWEEVGLCWFDVTVRGTFSYVGSRHRMPYRNAIVDAATVIGELEEWFAAYSARHTDGLVAPQGQIGAIAGGWSRMPSASPASCRFRVDLRISPRTTPAQARTEFRAALAGIRERHPEIGVDSELVLSIPGTATPAGSPVVTAAIAAWEALAGRPHEPIVANSGATDANILRSRGLPTARIGMDRIGPDAPIPLDFPAGMNVADVREMHRLTRHLVHTIVHLCA